MLEVYNAITNVAKTLKNDLFSNLCFDVQQIEAIIEKEFEWVKSTKSIISKSKKQFCTAHANGRFIVAYTPIDNQEIIDFDYSFGTLFSIYENEITNTNLVGSAYIAFGPVTQIVFATKEEGVKLFALEHGEFIFKNEIKLSNKGKINSCSGAVQNWSPEHKNFVDGFFNEGYRLRMSDSLTLDTHQILLKKGGIYSNPDEKFELNFEGYCIAFIVTLAGGKCTNGNGEDILVIQAKNLHTTTSLFFGSSYEMQKVRNTL